MESGFCLDKKEESASRLGLFYTSLAATNKYKEDDEMREFNFSSSDQLRRWKDYIDF